MVASAQVATLLLAASLLALAPALPSPVSVRQDLEPEEWDTQVIVSPEQPRFSRGTHPGLPFGDEGLTEPIQVAPGPIRIRVQLSVGPQAGATVPPGGPSGGLSISNGLAGMNPQLRIVGLYYRQGAWTLSYLKGANLIRPNAETVLALGELSPTGAFFELTLDDNGQTGTVLTPDGGSVPLALPESLYQATGKRAILMAAASQAGTETKVERLELAAPKATALAPQPR